MTLHLNPKNNTTMNRNFSIYFLALFLLGALTSAADEPATNGKETVAATAVLERSSEVDAVCQNLVVPGKLSRSDYDNDKNSLPHPLFKAYDLPKNINYFLMYFSASWCPPCQKFTPELVGFYNENQLGQKGVAIIFVSSDSNEEAMYRYMHTKKMPWPAVAYDKRSLSILQRLNISNLPGLVLMDAQGKVIATTQGDSDYNDPRTVLQAASKLPGFEQP